MAHHSVIRLTIEMTVDGDKSQGFDPYQYFRFLRCQKRKVILQKCVSTSYTPPIGNSCDNEQLQKLRKTNLHKAILKEIIGDHLKIKSQNNKKDNPTGKWSKFATDYKCHLHDIHFTFDDNGQLHIGNRWHGRAIVGDQLHFDLNDPTSLDKAKKIVDRAMLCAINDPIFGKVLLTEHLITAAKSIEAEGEVSA